MPPWRIHDKYAIMLGIPREVSREVNRIIDIDIVHDLGIKMPKEKWWVKENIYYIKKYIKAIASDSEEAEKRFREIKMDRAKREKMTEIIKVIKVREDYRRAFILHHALDLLCNDILVSFETLLRAMPKKKSDILARRTKENIIQTLQKDLTENLTNLGITSDSKVLEFLSENFSTILNDPEIVEWVNQLTQHRLDRKSKPPDLKWVDMAKINWALRTALTHFPISTMVTGGKTLERLAEHWSSSVKLSRVIRWLIDKNNIWEILRIDGFSHNLADFWLSKIQEAIVGYIRYGHITRVLDFFLEKIPEDFSDAIESLKKDIEDLRKFYQSSKNVG